MAYTTRTIGKSLSNGDYIEARVELRDDSGTLSPGFSVTGSIWEARRNGKGITRKNRGYDVDMGGCIHEEIAAHFPELLPVIAVHLASPEGLPMHAKANGWYFYSGDAAAYEREQVAKGNFGGYYSRMLEMSDHDRAARALHIDPDMLPVGLTREEFDAFVDSLAPYYAQRAEAARAVLAALPEAAE